MVFNGKTLVAVSMLSIWRVASVLAAPGDVPLHWTAPGDDGYAGTAHHFVIKYSSALITDSNWVSATEALNPPAPPPAGSSQNFTIMGLERGRRYYAAMKAYDEAGNVSAMSNIVSKFSSGIMTPSPVRANVDTSNSAATLYARAIESAMPLYYEFALDSTVAFLSPVINVGLVADSIVSSTYGSLRRNVRYFWRCRAVASDHSDSSLWSSADSFLIAGDNTVPMVTVVSPNGGEDWDMGSARSITWTDSDNVGIASHRIEYSTDAGTSWLLVRDWTAGDPHTFTWTVPGTVSAQCRVRVSGRDAANNVGTDVSNANFAIRDSQSPVVTVTAPDGGETWDPGSTQSITWADTDNVGLSDYRIEYSTDSGITWTLIADWTPGDPHAYSWTVPATISAQCRVRVSCRDASANAGSDMSNGDFVIQDSQPPSVMVNSPRGREKWDEMSIHSIIWSDSDNVAIEANKLEYSIDAGTSWTLVRDWMPGDPRSYSWAVPSTPSRQCRVRVTCRDAGGNVTSDASRRNFTIRDTSPPRVTVIFPNGGDSLQAGEDTVITWQASDVVGIDSFMIEYSLDAGINWNTITGWQGGNPGSYPWIVPDSMTSLCLLRVFCMDADSNVSADTSNGSFRIHDTLAPVVTIVHPTPEDTIDCDTILVSWVAQDNGVITSSSVDYSTDGGTSWINIWSGAGGDSSSIAWPNPGLTGNVGIRVSCADQSGNTGVDTVFLYQTDIGGKPGAFPEKYSLSEAYPNPFNPSTTIEFGLPMASHVTAEIYDLMGRRVQILINEQRQAGYYRVTWNAVEVPSGVYFCRILADKFSDTKKMLLLK